MSGHDLTSSSTVAIQSLRPLRLGSGLSRRWADSASVDMKIAARRRDAIRSESWPFAFCTCGKKLCTAAINAW